MKILRISALSFLVIGLAMFCQAQSKSEKPEEGEIKVVVIKNDNGKVSKVKEEFSLEEEQRLHELLKEHGVDIDLKELKKANGKMLDPSTMPKDKNVVVKVEVKEELNGEDVEKDVQVFKYINKESSTEVDNEKVNQIKKAVEAGDMKMLIELVGSNEPQMMFINEENMDVEMDSAGNKFFTKSFEMYSTKEGKKMGSMIFIKSKSDQHSQTDMPTEIREKFDDQSNLQDLNLYPNPTNNTFKMSFNSKEEKDYQLSIIDTKGSIIYEKQLTNFKGSFNEDFDLSKYDNGIYFFNLNSEEEKISKKIVVQ